MKTTSVRLPLECFVKFKVYKDLLKIDMGELIRDFVLNLLPQPAFSKALMDKVAMPQLFDPELDFKARATLACTAANCSLFFIGEAPYITHNYFSGELYEENKTFPLSTQAIGHSVYRDIVLILNTIALATAEYDKEQARLEALKIISEEKA